MALYVSTLAPDVVGHDAGEFQFVPYLLGIAHYTGYPLYTLLGKLWTLVAPIGNIAYRMNLLSALFAALAVALACQTARELGAGRLAAVLGAATLALSPLFWTWGTIAGVRSLTSLFTLVLAWLAARWAERPDSRGRLLWLAGVFGLALTHHRSLGLFAPCLLLLLLWRRPGLLRRPPLLAQALGVALAPLVLYLYLPIRAAMHPPFDQFRPDTWQGFSNLVLAGADSAAHLGMPWSELPTRLGLLVNDAVAQLGWAGLLLGALGLGALLAGRPWLGVPYLLFVLSVALLTLEWDVGPGRLNAVYLAPAYALWVAFLSLGAQALLAIRSPRSNVQGGGSGGTGFPACAAGTGDALTPTLSHWERGFPKLRVLQAGIAAVLVLLLMPQWALGWRVQDERRAAGLALDRFRLGLESGEAPRRLAASSLPRLEPDAQLVAEWDQATVFWYLQLVEGVNPDVAVSYPSATLEEVARRAPGRPLYAAAAFPSLAGRRLTNVGAIVRVQADPDLRGQPPLSPLGLRFGDDLRLLGATFWDDVGRPAPGLPPRQEVAGVTLEWQALRQISDDLSVSLRVVDSGGQPVRQVDNRNPVLGMYPTSRWVAGERVADYYELSLAGLPRGRHRLALVVYASSPAGFRDLPAYDASHASLGETATLAEINR